MTEYLVGNQLRDAMIEAWPYGRAVMTVFECRVCRCLVVNRSGHALTCLTSMDQGDAAELAIRLGVHPADSGHK